MPRGRSGGSNEQEAAASASASWPHPPNQAASVGTGKTEEETEQCGKESNRYNQKVHHVNSVGPDPRPTYEEFDKEAVCAVASLRLVRHRAKNGNRTLYLHAPRGQYTK